MLQYIIDAIVLGVKAVKTGLLEGHSLPCRARQCPFIAPKDLVVGVKA